MIAVENMTDAEFETVAFDVLSRELGAAGLLRFLRMHRAGTGDYTAERESWQRNVTVDEIQESIQRRQNKVA